MKHLENIRLCKSNNIIDRKFGETRYIINYISGEIFKLNSTAEFIWKVIDNSNLKSLILLLSNQFSLPDEHANHILKVFIDRLYNARLINTDDEKLRGTKPLLHSIHTRNSVNELWEVAKNNIIPIKVDLELTYRCNLNCKYCYISQKYIQNELDLNQIKKLIKEIRSEGCVFLTLTGGEPLLRSDIINILQYARRENLLIRLLTNGTLINKNIAEKIADMGVVSVEISLHNLVSTLHDRFTDAKGSFDKAVYSAKQLRDLNVDVSFKFTVTKENFCCLKDIKYFSKTIGIPFIINAIIFPKLDSSVDTSKFFMSEDQLEKAIQQEYIAADSHECVSGTAKCTISPSGQVFPCEFIRKELGNIKETEFNHIWNSDDFLTFRNSSFFAECDQCKNCEFNDSCRKCPGLAFLEKGDFQNKFSQTCKIAQIAVLQGETRDSHEWRSLKVMKEKDLM